MKHTNVNQNLARVTRLHLRPAIYRAKIPLGECKSGTGYAVESNIAATKAPWQADSKKRPRETNGRATRAPQNADRGRGSFRGCPGADCRPFRPPLFQLENRPIVFPS